MTIAQADDQGSRMAVGRDRAALIRVLAEIYPDDESVRRLLAFSDVPTSLVRFASRPLDTWFGALTEIDQRGRRADFLKVVLAERPDNAALHSALRSALQAAGSAGTEVPGSAAVEGIEKIMGVQSTLLPISFLERGLRRASSVVRISSPEGLGTGFLIEGNYIVTNHHVIGSIESAREATARFNFQEDVDGTLLQSDTHTLRPAAGFVTSPEDDLTVISVDQELTLKWGPIRVPDGVDHSIKRVNIIQHPGGGPKQVALYHNVVSYSDDSRIQYYTDTLPGSSGSPLFDDAWRLVGVHHAGGNLFSPSEKTWIYRNEGIAAGRLARLLATLNRRG